jgi:uncharacterized protein (UPF0332 family)
MPRFDPKNFLKVAKTFTDSNIEEEVRTMVNRAYYAAFGVARSKTGVSDKVGTHKKVIDALFHSDKTNFKIASKSLENLYEKRKNADYDYKETLYANKFANVLIDAEYIIQKLEEKEQID